MNLFLAAVYTNSYKNGQARYEKLNDQERNIVDNIPHHLESYHYVSSQKFVDAMRRDGAKVFLDSGAFSAKSLGVDINIDDYCNYIKRNHDILRVEDGITMASVLDGIGDDLQTWRNQLYMETQGVRPLPCFHFGEDDRFLEWYVSHYDYITLGGMSHSQKVVTQWLDRIWNKHLVDGSGRARVKVHAFGVTSENLMERYPWHSVDSSSWIQGAAFGSVFTAKYGPIPVSAKSPARHTAGQHISTLSKPDREFMDSLLAENGFSYERLSTVYESRAVFNIQNYIKLNAILDAYFENKGPDLAYRVTQTLF